MGVKRIEFRHAAVEELYSTVRDIVEFVGGWRMGGMGGEDCIVGERGGQ